MPIYEIVLGCKMDKKRFCEFANLEVEMTYEGNTLLTAGFQDSAELFALLRFVRDLNVTLISLQLKED
jgi:hypothetical protein